MSIHSVPDRELVLSTGRAHPELAAAVAAQLQLDLLPMTAYDFANSETYVRYTESIRGKDIFLFQSGSTPVNQSLMELLLMLDAAKRASAGNVTAVVPFMPYARQDKKSRGREPISARLVADLLTTAGADRVMSIDLHTSQIQGFFDIPVDHLGAMPVLVDYVRGRVDIENVAVVSPDAGRIKVAEQWAASLGGCPLAFVHKTRDVTQPNKSHANRIVGDVAGRDAVLVDDLIDTGGTICEATKVILDAGAKSVTVAATHGVLSLPAPQRLHESGAREVVITDTLPISASQRFQELTVLPIAPMMARAIKQVFDGGSVTSLFDGSMLTGLA
ncbi:MAG: ribose-phosphate diphosphokinase [Promicromonosporaceae bacterium]|nr:ribose-phosphate diphosphokinase [Promicromonosporaceae bacterium]